MKQLLKNICTGLLLGALGFFPAISHAEELLVGYDEYNSSKNAYIPFDPYESNWSKGNQKTEIIYPETKLQDLKNSEITGLKFYANNGGVDWDCEFTIFLKELDENSFSSNSFNGYDDSDIVYQGSTLSLPSSKEMVINFTSSYLYKGGNLLVGF